MNGSGLKIAYNNLISQLKVKEKVHALSSTQMSKLKELETTAQCELMCFYVCMAWMRQGTVTASAGDGVGVLDDIQHHKSIASEKCSKRHSASASVRNDSESTASFFLALQYSDAPKIFGYSAIRLIGYRTLIRKLAKL
jgi:hypothetical protein